MNKFEVNTSVVDEEIIINEFDALEIENSTPEVEAIQTPPDPTHFYKDWRTRRKKTKINQKK